MATITFNVPQNFIDKLKNKPSAVGEVLNEVFGLGDNAKVICDSLVAFHDDGSPVVDEFELGEEVVYNPATHKGKLVFKYWVHYHFGCSDISSKEPATERCEFEVDITRQQLLVHIHDPIRRDTIDEF
jgi:hypothetical protein